MILRILLESTMLRSVGYHPQLFILEMEYRGRHYRDVRHYEGVPFWVPLELMAAPSKGAYYHSRIRGQFKGRVVSPEDHLFGTPPWGGGGELWPWAFQPPQPDGRLWAADYLSSVADS